MTDSCQFIAQIRSQLTLTLNEEFQNEEIVRYYQAANHSIPRTLQNLRNTSQWRQSHLPGKITGTSPNNIIEKLQNEVNFQHMYDEVHPMVITAEGHGEHSVLYEKVGSLSVHFSELLQHYSVDDLVLFHIRNLEIMKLQMIEQSNKKGHLIDQFVYIIDAEGIQMTPNLNFYQYIHRTIVIDQEHYPGLLHTMFIINCPWYISTLFAVISPFINATDRKRVVMLGHNYHDALHDYLNFDKKEFFMIKQPHAVEHTVEDETSTLKVSTPVTVCEN